MLDNLLNEGQYGKTWYITEHTYPKEHRSFWSTSIGMLNFILQHQPASCKEFLETSNHLKLILVLFFRSPETSRVLYLVAYSIAL